MSVRQSLLALLAEGPRHGYQLRQDFEARTGGTWPLNVGQVYTTLARLERDGLVEVADGADEAQKLYSLTNVGRAELELWFATPVRRGDRPRDELAIKLAMAASLGDVDVRSVVQAQRTDTLRALQDYTKLKSRATAEDLPWLLVLDSLIFTTEAEARWLDAVEARLARHRPTAAPAGATLPEAVRR
jgi:DNA-binding PadR family transcriptional regulator